MGKERRENELFFLILLVPSRLSIMKYAYQEEVEVLEEVLIEDETIGSRELIVLNDDYNTFEHVIKTLIRVCKHTPEQAEQCTLLIHYKGQCSVKQGTFEELKPMCEAIHEVGIGAEIQ